MSATKPRVSVEAVVTERWIALLEDAIKTGKPTPFRRPWRSIGGDGFQRNLVSQRAYRGSNVFMLAAQGFTSPWWLSWKEAKQLGGAVREGEPSTIVTWWKRIEVEPRPGYTGRLTPEGKQVIFMLRYFRVWNVEQVDGLDEWIARNRPSGVPDADADAAALPDDVERALDALEHYVERENIGLAHGGDRAWYAPAADAIRLPPVAAFHAAEGYLSTFAHEAGHSTGHADRLNRAEVAKLAVVKGDGDYAREELVAEMAAGMFMARMRLDSPEHDGNRVAYLRSWLNALKDDTRLVVSAAGRAQAAVDLILGSGSEPNEPRADGAVDTNNPKEG